MSIKAYKGFNKDMTCRGFQFKEGETYHEDEAKLCEKGFHACLDPLDCFNYYSPATSVYHEVELDDVTNENNSNDSKVCGKTIKVGAALDVAGFVKAKFEYTKSKCEKEIKASGNKPVSGGDRSAVSGGDGSVVSGGYWSAVSGGYRSVVSGGYWSAVSGGDGSAVSGGDRSAVSGGDGSVVSGGYGSAVSGGYGSAVSGGENSVLATFNGKAKAGLNSLIAIVNREWIGDEWKITEYAAAIVDGKTIKPDTWYMLKGGKFVEVSDDEKG